MNIKNKDLILIIIILLGLLIRLFLAFLPGFKIDMDAWFAWAMRLNQVGFTSFYSDSVWTNYTPGYLYILYILGLVKNSFNIDDQSFYLILKLPAILADIGLSLVVYKLIAKKSVWWAKICAILIVLNPAFIFNSAIWGQIDGLLTILLVLSIIFLNKKRLIFSSIFFALGLLIKPQAILMIPVFIIYFLFNFSSRNIIKFMMTFLALIYIFSYPFYINNPIIDPINLFIRMIGDYPHTSAFAYNLWGVVGFWISDSEKFIGLTYQNIGYILVLVYWIIIGSFYLKKRMSLFNLATLAALSFYFLPTRVHDRYLYPALIFLFISAALFRSYLLLGFSTALSLIHFLNLYYVYVYYNEFYLNLPKLLFTPFMYQILDANGKQFSLVSVVIFFLITTTIIKYNVKSKKT